MGLGGAGDRDDSGDELVRVGNPQWPLIQASAVGVDDGCGRVKNLFRCGLPTGILLFLFVIGRWR